ncbi:MAG TPA: D-glycerate dehydrogenase [Dehalococcoidia bacterium]|nr:D-glycerate dehydrogenase [Dehalococcoidia bacterium]
MVKRPRVFVTRRLVGEGVLRLAGEADVEVWPEDDSPPQDVLVTEAQRSDGILTNIADRVDAELITAAPGLRVVSQMAVGYDNIDVVAATQRGVLVTNTPGVLTEATADIAFALLLAQTRRLPEGDRAMRRGEWGEWKPWFLLGRDLTGKTLGIVGLGAIGQAMARRALGFGMRVIYASRQRKPDAEAALGVVWRDLPQLLAESDYVSLHMALNAETRAMIGAPELARMKRDAVLINTARGGVVDQAALLEALRNGVIGGAGLDVFESEPLSPDHPLLELDNVVVTPHLGSATVETRSRMSDLAVDNLIAFFRGEMPPCMVNPEVLART